MLQNKGMGITRTYEKMKRTAHHQQNTPSNEKRATEEPTRAPTVTVTRYPESTWSISGEHATLVALDHTVVTQAVPCSCVDGEASVAAKLRPATVNHVPMLVGVFLGAADATGAASTHVLA